MNLDRIEQQQFHYRNSAGELRMVLSPTFAEKIFRETRGDWTTKKFDLGAGVIEYRQCYVIAEDYGFSTSGIKLMLWSGDYVERRF